MFRHTISCYSDEEIATDDSLYPKDLSIRNEHCSIDFCSSQATMELFPTSWNEMNEENCVSDSFLSR